MFEFSLTALDQKARIGLFNTPHGTIETPVFMPVGTHAAVKSVSAQELEISGSQIILSNTYHLYLRPGEKIVEKVGGLHAFMQWKGPILTDSGGFQVFSLGERGMSGSLKKSLRTVAEEGITFQSHLDGSYHLFTPEKSIEVQQALGADIIMAFDQPVYGMSAAAQAEQAMLRTQRWLKRSQEQWKQGRKDQALFGIVQGGVHTKLHQQSAEFTAALDLPGNAIGGLSVGEGKKAMWEAVSSINALLPSQKPRYFMGLGEPLDLIEATLRGVDMYDCVAPSRLARHGVIWQVRGAEEAFYSGDTDALLASEGVIFERWNLHNARFTEEKKGLPGAGWTLPGDLAGFPLATLHHYVKKNEILGYRILTLHNIATLHLITKHLKNAIRKGLVSKLQEKIK